MVKIKLLIVIFLFGLTACKKKNIYCDNAELQVKNMGMDTVYFGFNNSLFSDTLLPGSSISYFVGQIQVNNESKKTVTVNFESTHGNFSVEVDDCLVKREIQ